MSSKDDAIAQAVVELDKLKSLEQVNLALAAILAIQEDATRFKSRMGPFCE